MGDYYGSDNLHMQEMGDDAGVIVGWDESIEVSFFYNNCIQVIQILKIMTKVALLYLDKKSNDNAAILLPMNPQQRAMTDDKITKNHFSTNNETNKNLFFKNVHGVLENKCDDTEGTTSNSYILWSNG